MIAKRFKLISSGSSSKSQRFSANLEPYRLTKKERQCFSPAMGTVEISVLRKCAEPRSTLLGRQESCCLVCNQMAVTKMEHQIHLPEVVDGVPGVYYMTKNETCLFFAPYRSEKIEGTALTNFNCYSRVAIGDINLRCRAPAWTVYQKDSGMRQQHEQCDSYGACGVSVLWKARTALTPVLVTAGGQ